MDEFLPLFEIYFRGTILIGERGSFVLAFPINENS